MKVGVFHPGTQHSWQTALALQSMDRLAWYATSIFYKTDEWPYRAERYLPTTLRKRVSSEFQRFAMPALDPELVRTHGIEEWLERIANRFGQRKLAKWFDRLGNRNFVNGISSLITENPDIALWGYNGSSLSTFQAAKSNGIHCVLDRTIGDGRAYNAAMLELMDDWNDWFLPVEKAVPQRVIENDDQEYALADQIVVGCDYAKQTILEHSAQPNLESKISVLDYCYDEALFAPLPQPRAKKRGGPVRFLYLGLAIPRKGIHHVLEAMDAFSEKDAVLTIVGDMKIPANRFAKYQDRVTYVPTVARSDVPAIMAQHDVLLLPTYHEGAGIVLYEALAAGMGIIQSDRAALVATEKTGIILDELSTGALSNAMLVPIEDRGRLAEWRQSAQGAAKNYTFERYRTGIERLLAEAGI